MFCCMVQVFFTQGYFDSLRMEVKCDNIDIQLVCPGPVVSSVSLNAFSSQLDKAGLYFLVLHLVDFILYLACSKYG